MTLKARGEEVFLGGRKTDPQWANRRRLLCGRERLRPDTLARLCQQTADAARTKDLGVRAARQWSGLSAVDRSPSDCGW
ncbi:MAG: hypothetical protein M3P93_05845 [Actinomycetota bacterium]|nr:hypothetical protein [Actinomycetota bacterium]